MSYISIIVPAFHLNTSDKNEIINYCCSQFNVSQENFSLIQINNDNINYSYSAKENNHYGVIFNESNLSLHKIEQLIYERNCIQNLSEKAFENLQLLSKKIIELEKTINTIKESKNNNGDMCTKPVINSIKIGDNNNCIKDEEKNENNKIEYSKKNIKKINIEYKNMIDDIELLNNNKIKKYIQKDIILDKLKDEDKDKDNIMNDDDFLSN